MLSNPPYGKSWKSDLERMGGKSDITDPRFVVEHAGDADYSLITRSSDGQMMFLANMLSKMKPEQDQQGRPAGSRVAEVHNGSSLFTGDAGQGESNIRRWIIENDWLEAIVALPLNMFYNTGIATYVWVLGNRQGVAPQGQGAAHRRDAVVPAAAQEPRRQDCELSDEDIGRICGAFLAFEETEQSKIFPNEALGYWKVTVERPLRLTVGLSAERRQGFRDACRAANEEPLANVVDRVAAELGPGPHRDFNRFMSSVAADAAAQEGQDDGQAQDTAQDLPRLSRRDRRTRGQEGLPGGSAEPDPVRGLYPVAIDGEPVIVEYEPDTDLRDTEQVPLLHEGGIEAFIGREVLPYAPDAWYAPDSVKIGYEISFTRHFYKPQPLRPLEEIRADILALERETEGLLAEIVVAGGAVDGR